MKLKLAFKSRMIFLMKVSLFTLIILTLSTFVIAQGVDPNYHPTVSLREDDSGYTDPKISIQADGKFLVYGEHIFHNISGTPISKMVRLNADGTLDNTFRYESSVLIFVDSVQIQSDGKIVIGGAVGANTPPKVARLNPDGSLDTTFTSAIQAVVNTRSTQVWEIQPDGKILVAVASAASGLTRVFRMNSDGSKDTTFHDVEFDLYGNNNEPFEFLYDVKILDDGKIMIAGSHRTLGKLFRLHSNGLVDSSFPSPTFPGMHTFIRSFDIQSDGKIVIFGEFTTLNGISRIRFARLNADGSVDTTFRDGTYPFSATKVRVLSDDSIFVSYEYNSDGSHYKYTPDGFADKSYTRITRSRYYALDSSERIIASQKFELNSSPTGGIQRIKRFDTNGIEDNSFTEVLLGRSGEVVKLAIQPDGKILIDGSYNLVNGTIETGLKRLDTDGSIDTGFNTDDLYGVAEIRVQDDGKIMLVRSSGLSNSSDTGIIRLNSDGSRDTSFVFPTIIDFGTNGGPRVYDYEFQPDDKLLVVGQFHNVDGQACHNIFRMNTDGSLDNSFQCLTMSGRNTSIRDIAIKSDGKFIIGGSFSGGINGINRRHIARLNSDGTLDSSFNVATAGQSENVFQIHQEETGKLVLLTSTFVRRVNEDGSDDTSFTKLPYHANTLLAQSDGTYIIGGDSNFSRLANNGTVDLSFFPNGFEGKVNGLVRQDDGQIIVGGEFNTIGNYYRSGLARFNPPAFQNTADYDFDGDGKADIAVFRPSENKWYVLRSADGAITQKIFAINGDSPVASDFDGDGKTDFSIFRNSLGDWWSLSSANGNQAFAHLGQNGDIPRPADFDGDGRADYVVYRPTDFTWYRTTSGNGTVSNKQFGAAGDKPLVGDFDGDGKSDVAIFRPSTGDWWWQSSIDNIQNATHWGAVGDIPSPGDYDGDGKTDFAVYRPSIGVWYVLNSGSGNTAYTIIQFGIAEDKVAPADYDGDGKTDIAVYRPSTGVWYLLQSTNGFAAYQFGISTDIPVPNALIP